MKTTLKQETIDALREAGAEAQAAILEDLKNMDFDSIPDILENTTKETVKEYMPNYSRFLNRKKTQ